MEEWRKWERRLTDSEMEWIHQLLESTQLLGERISSVIVFIHNIALKEWSGKGWEEHDEVKATWHAIPNDQWEEIATWMQEVAGSDGVSAVLMFMNSGPGTYVETSDSKIG